MLFFLSPTVGELLSGSSPPVEFFRPFPLLLLACLYGGGALLAREFTLAWGKGWPTLLALGVAYAIVEEGLCCKSFFDANWPDVGILGSYGRWLGVNWVWAAHLTIFHTIFSILVPITLVELVFPARRHESWVGPRMRWALAALLAMVVGLGFLVFPDAKQPFRPSPIGYALAILAVVAIMLGARCLPSFMNRAGAGAGEAGGGLAAQSAGAAARPLWFGLLGFLGTLAFFAVFWLLPKTSLAPLATVGIGLGLGVVVFGLGWRLAGGGFALPEAQQFALAAGALVFFVVLAPIQEADNARRPDDTTGMTIVGLATLGGLLWLGWRLRRRRRLDVPAVS